MLLLASISKLQIYRVIMIRNLKCRIEICSRRVRPACQSSTADRRNEADCSTSAGYPKNAFQALPLPPFMKYHNEIERRKTFAIISHPDAGKITLRPIAFLVSPSVES